MQTKWIAITAASALGVGSIAAGAISIANAIEIRDARGDVIAAAPISGDIAGGGAVEIKTTGDHASVVSPAEPPSATSAPSAQAAEQPAAQQPVQQAPAPVAVPSAHSVHSVDSVD